MLLHLDSMDLHGPSSQLCPVLIPLGQPPTSAAILHSLCLPEHFVFFFVSTEGSSCPWDWHWTALIQG